MKISKQKIVGSILPVVFAMSILTGCGGTGTGSESTAGDTTAGQSSSQAASESQPEEKAPTTLRIFMQQGQTWAGVPYDNFSIHYIEEKTNTKWDIVPALATATMGLDDLVNLQVAAGEKYDLIQFSQDSKYLEMVTYNYLYPLSDSFDKAPNLAKWGEGAMWDVMKVSDGKIYAVPQKSMVPSDFVNMYRKDWLDKLGLKVPETLDEYYEAAVKMSEKDPDGDKNKKTYAFGAYGTGDLRTFDHIFGAYGTGDLRTFDHIFGAYGVMPDLWLERDGHLVCSAIMTETKEALKMLNRLYTAGAIDPEFVTDTEARYKDKFRAGTYGALSYKTYAFCTENFCDFYDVLHENNPTAVIVKGPVLKGASDKPLGGRMGNPASFLKTGIPATSTNVDAAVRVLDWLASVEGNMFINYGIEGEHYTKAADGFVTDLVPKEEDKKSLGIGQSLLLYMKRFDAVSPEFREINDYAASIAVSNLKFGLFVKEQSQYENQLGQLRKERFAGMITGSIQIDGGFEDFVAEWNKIGGEKLTVALDEAYQRKQGKN